MTSKARLPELMRECSGFLRTPAPPCSLPATHLRSLSCLGSKKITENYFWPLMWVLQSLFVPEDTPLVLMPWIFLAPYLCAFGLKIAGAAQCGFWDPSCSWMPWMLRFCIPDSSCGQVLCTLIGCLGSLNMGSVPREASCALSLWVKWKLRSKKATSLCPQVDYWNLRL